MAKFGWKGLVGLVISALCLYIAFRNFDFADAIAQAKQANYGLLALSIIAATGMFPLRARRWRTILDPIAADVPFGPLWRATAIGVMLTNVLPARAGELARPYALSREVAEVPFTTALASVAVDRVFDAIVVLLLLAVSMVAPGFPSDVKIQGYPIGVLARTFALGPVVLLLMLYSLVFFPDRLIALFEMVARRVSPVIEKRGAEVLRRFADGLSVLRNPKHFFAVFFWTLLHWLLQPLAFWLGFRAFGIDVPWTATLFVQGIIVLFVAIPSSPGFVGLFETAAKVSLAVYGVNETSAVTWGAVFHLLSYIPITLIGAYYFFRAGLSMGDIASAATDKQA
jgi:uncharacterized protein (TIRG00374 family)